MGRYEEADWYDLPLYYDIVYDPDTALEADFLAAVYARFVGGPPGRVLEPACGTGRLMTALAARGFSVSGFDLSEPMLAFARARLDEAAVEAPLETARFEDFSLAGPFDFAHCLVSSFKYVLSEAAAQAHLERMARVLRKGGVYALGLHLTDYEEDRRQRERWVGEREGIKVTNNLQAWPADRQARRERLRSRLIVERAGAVHRYETVWSFRTYSARQLKALLKKVPAFEHVATFDFRYSLDERVALDDEGLDKLLVLRRR